MLLPVRLYSVAVSKTSERLVQVVGIQLANVDTHSPGQRTGVVLGFEDDPSVPRFKNHVRFQCRDHPPISIGNRVYLNPIDPAGETERVGNRE